MTDSAAPETSEPTSKDYYFDSYQHFGIHEEMLKDTVRTESYQRAIMQNPHLFKGKIVLDVGCGTSILSMFAARAGAKHVYGVDCSRIIEQAKLIVSANNLNGQITLIQGKIEDIELPVEQVDIIVSEWMGYFLLYESMLDTVLFARDKWLKPGGLLLPDKAVLYLAAVEESDYRAEKINFWDNVYGFDLSAIKKIAITEPTVEFVNPTDVCSTSSKILALDLLTCDKEDVNFRSEFKLKLTRNDYVHGFVSYFECAFTQIHKPIGFSTAPFAKCTHWKQTLFFLDSDKEIIGSAGEEITGTIACQQNSQNKRDLDIDFTINFVGENYKLKDHQQRYTLK